MNINEAKKILNQNLSELTPRERAFVLVKRAEICRKYGVGTISRSNEPDTDRALRCMRRVSFLRTREERELYAGALLSAIRWAMK